MLGRILILIGLLFVVVGALLLLAERFPQLRIGRLPGDLYIERPRWRFAFPLMTCLIASAIASLLLWLLRRR